jgi:hypothetical protein
MVSSDSSLRAHILAYIESASARDPDDEGLDVALQCLRESFGKTALPAVPETSLLAVFEAGRAALAQGSAPPSDRGFERFVSTLSQRGYFAGCVPGSAEYNSRLASAQSRFAARFPPGPAGAQAGAPADAGVAGASAAPRSSPDGHTGASVHDLLISSQFPRALDEVTKEIERVERDVADAECELVDAGSAEPLVELLALRSLACLGMGQLDAATSDADACVALASGPRAQSIALTSRGICVEARGELSEASSSYTQALSVAGAPSARFFQVLSACRPALLLAARAAPAYVSPSGSEASGQQPGSAAVGSSTGNSALTLRPVHALGMPTSQPLDMSFMNAFLTNPDVLATAERVADSFLEGECLTSPS